MATKRRRWGLWLAALVLLPLLAYAPFVVWEYSRPFPPPPAHEHRAATTEDHPWLVAITYPEAYPDRPSAKGCVGTLVAPQAVVTAAHCVGRYAPEDLVVVTDRDDLTDTNTGTSVEVSGIWAHPDYMTHDDGFVLSGIYRQVELAPADIAVLILAEETANTTLPLATPDNPPPAGEPMEMLGYRLSPDDEPLLWRQSSTVEDDATCVERAASARRTVLPQWRGARYDTASYLCASDGRTLVRASDSGAPLVVNGRLTGVAAFSPGADFALPSYYTRVSTYAPEIQDLLDATTAGETL